MTAVIHDNNARTNVATTTFVSVYSREAHTKREK